ncbi:unnamed protein product [Pedinophyceae sp. YPF-701]|nr:unnamed protein product [Pedinophyceae sp. YPF-701]
MLAGALALSQVSDARASESLAPLKRTGGRGFLAEEEEILYEMRLEKEAEAQEEIAALRAEYEEAARATQDGKLCATPYGIDVVGITEAVALVGAAVGGISARNKRAELQRVTEQLRTINYELRNQARAGMVYAPGLSYAPPTGSDQEGGTAVLPPLEGVPTEVAPPREAPPTPPPAMAAAAASPPEAEAAADDVTQDPSASSRWEASLDEEPDETRLALREGKRLLKAGNGNGAMVRFEKALVLSRAMGMKVQERRAMRGMAAAARIQGKYKDGIEYLEGVLRISGEIQDYVGDADAYGTIADLYTELGDYEKAAEYYDLYLAKCVADGPV